MKLRSSPLLDIDIGGGVGASGIGPSGVGGGPPESLDLEGLAEWDQTYMLRALQLAVDAYEQDEVPVGAVVVHEGRVIGAGWNQREALKDPTAHAEMIAITQAAAALENWRLSGCTLYVTLEPCPMCAGAILQARIPRVVYGAVDPKGGAVDTLYQILSDSRLNHRSDITSGVMEADCGALLTAFFREKRQQGKK